MGLDKVKVEQDENSLEEEGAVMTESRPRKKAVPKRVSDVQSSTASALREDEEEQRLERQAADAANSNKRPRQQRSRRSIPATRMLDPTDHIRGEGGGEDRLLEDDSSDDDQLVLQAGQQYTLVKSKNNRKKPGRKPKLAPKAAPKVTAKPKPKPKPKSKTKAKARPAPPSRTVEPLVSASSVPNEYMNGSVATHDPSLMVQVPMPHDYVQPTPQPMQQHPPVAARPELHPQEGYRGQILSENSLALLRSLAQISFVPDVTLPDPRGPEDVGKLNRCATHVAISYLIKFDKERKARSEVENVDEGDPVETKGSQSGEEQPQQQQQQRIESSGEGLQNEAKNVTDEEMKDRDGAETAAASDE